MPERVVPFRENVRWEPNAPHAVLVVNDAGRSALAVQPHPDDIDLRAVVIVWDRCASAEMCAPNDEARHHHRLYPAGLNGLLWLGEVESSERLAEISATVASHALRHFVVPLKEGTVEVLAEEVNIMRLAGPTAQAALQALLA